MSEVLICEIQEMSSEGFTVEEIAWGLNLSEVQIIDAIQKGSSVSPR